MCNSEQHAVLLSRLDALETQVATLHAWTVGWPAERERAAITALMRAELDLYRTAAELAMKDLASVLHEEIAALKSGMTEGAQDALADMGTKMQMVVDMHRRTQENQTAILGRLEKVATTQDQAATFDAGVERLVAIFQPSWEAQKAELDATRAAEEARRAEQAAHEAREKAARVARDRARAEQRARLYQLAQSLAVPVLMSAIGTPLALLTSISGTLPQRAVVVLSLVIFTLGCGFALYWAVIRRPPAPMAVETEERSVDTLPAAVAPLPPADGSTPPAAPVVTTATTTVTTTVAPPEPPQETP